MAHQKQMKRRHYILTILSFTYLSAFAQGQYGQTLQTQTIYPLETAQFFRSGQGGQPFRSMAIPPHFYANPPSVAYVPEGFYLFKRKKKRHKVNYAKKSRIIRF